MSRRMVIAASWVALIVSQASLGTSTASPAERHASSTAVQLNAEPAGCASPSKFHGKAAADYRSDCRVCRMFGPKVVAREFHMRTTDLVLLAIEYAKNYRPALSSASFAGCLHGFHLRKTP